MRSTPSRATIDLAADFTRCRLNPAGDRGLEQKPMSKTSRPHASHSRHCWVVHVYDNTSQTLATYTTRHAENSPRSLDNHTCPRQPPALSTHQKPTQPRAICNLQTEKSSHLRRSGDKHPKPNQDPTAGACKHPYRVQSLLTGLHIAHLPMNMRLRRQIKTGQDAAPRGRFRMRACSAE